MKILIAGDLVPTEKNKELFIDGDLISLMGNDLFSIWENTEFKICNLETPISDEAEPIEKKGPNLKASMNTINGIKKLAPNLIVLANNHILDQGVKGLDSTIKALRDNNIEFIGAGKNIYDASKPYIIENKGLKIGIYSCAEHEFSIATKETPGANLFDPLESLDHIQKLKKECDYVFVLYHGGKEHYRYPSPYLQKVSRKIVEKGADLVVCQHSHCIGAYENYNNSTIIYGQGNFIFNKHDNEYWNNSILIDVNIQDSMKVDFIPIVTTGKGIRLANVEEKRDILMNFFKRSEEILEEGFIEKKYNEFARKSIDNYLRKLFGFGKWKSRIDRKLFGGFLLRKKSNKENLLAIQNYIECEAHRELLLKGIKARRNDL
jgi:poly-gamma-glutamate synthesis protein (capsule biosynthesis protein)